MRLRYFYISIIIEKPILIIMYWYAVSTHARTPCYTLHHCSKDTYTRTMNEQRVWNVSYFLSYTALYNNYKSRKYPHHMTGTHVAPKVIPDRAGILSPSAISFDIASTHIIVVVAYLCNMYTYYNTVRVIHKNVGDITHYRLTHYYTIIYYVIYNNMERHYLWGRTMGGGRWTKPEKKIRAKKRNEPKW